MKTLSVNTNEKGSGRTSHRISTTLVLLSMVVFCTTAQSIQKSIEASCLTSTRIDIKSANTSDQMWLITNAACTNSYDNGWDGRKILGSQANVQLYAQATDGNIYQVDAVSNIDKTDLGFRANGDNEFMMIFTHQYLSPTYSSMYLYDKVMNSLVDVTATGSQYSFQATETGQCETRFKIYTNMQSYNQDHLTTGVEPKNVADISIENASGEILLHNKSEKNGDISLYSETGKCLGSQKFEANNDTQINHQTTSGMVVARVTTDDNEVKIFKILFR